MSDDVVALDVYVCVTAYHGCCGNCDDDSDWIVCDDDDDDGDDVTSLHWSAVDVALGVHVH